MDATDLEVGCAHIVARAVASLRRVRALQRNYAAMEGVAQTSIFDDLEAI